MEADIAAIRQSVAVIEWCCTVLVYAGIPAIGVYLFRLVVLARERMARNKVIGILLTLSIGSTANANVWETAVGGTIGGGFVPSLEPLVINTCTSATSAQITVPEGEGLPAGTYRRIVITTKQHRADDGPDTSGDVDIKWVKFIQCYDGPTGAVWHTKTFGRLSNADPGTPWIEGVPEWATTQPCVDCAPQCATCIFVALFDYYSGLGWRRYWPIGVSAQQQYDYIHADGDVSGCEADAKDSDGDGIPDHIDPDDDNDGIPDNEDPDDDGDGVPDHNDPDKDDDGDGIPNPQDPDDDGDGTPDNQDPDHPTGPGQGGPGDGDGDGIPDGQDPDDDGDGIPDVQDPDDDNDGVPDNNDPDHPKNPGGDPDNDGIPNNQDPDDDNDGIPDNEDPDHPAHPNNPIGDPDDDGIPNEEDPDDDNDGTPDGDDDCPAGGDCDGDPDNNGDPGESGYCSSVSFTRAFTEMIKRSLGFDGAMLEEEAAAWENAGGLGLRVPYWNPISYQSGNWSPSYILVTPEGKVQGPDFDEVTIPHWEESAAIVKTGLSAILVIWFAGAMFRLVTGAGGDE